MELQSKYFMGDSVLTDVSWLAFLAVGGLGAVLALVVVLADVVGEPCRWSIQSYSAIGEAGDEFEQVGVLDGGGGSFSPGKGRMAGDKDAGDGERIEGAFLEEAGDHCTGVEDVGLFDFGGGERCGDGDFAVEVVGVGGSKAGDGSAGLGPGGGELGMGVDDAADLGKFTIEKQVGVEVAGGVQSALDDGAVERGEDQVVHGHGGVGHAAGLDGDERAGATHAGAVDAADVAESVEGEAAAGDFLVGVKDLFAKGREEHGVILAVMQKAFSVLRISGSVPRSQIGCRGPWNVGRG